MSPISVPSYNITVPDYQEALAWLDSENSYCDTVGYPEDSWSEAARLSLEQAVRKLSVMEGRLGHARKISTGSLRPLQPIDEELEETLEVSINTSCQWKKRNAEDPKTPVRSRSNSNHSLRHKRSRDCVFPANSSDEDLLRAFPSPPRQSIPPRKSSLAIAGSGVSLRTPDDGYHSLPGTPAVCIEGSAKSGDCQCGSAVLSDLDPSLAARFVIRISSLSSLSKSSNSDKELARRKLQAALYAIETTE